MQFNYYLLDTFAREKFTGNPTPVCVTDKIPSSATMHAYAKEFAAPVSVFVEQSTNQSVYKIRYYTVTGEIPACGHATVGAAYVMLNQSSDSEINFETLENIRLTCKKENDLIFVEYPKFNPAEFKTSAAVLKALNLNDFLNSFYCEELQSFFIELRTENEVRKINPDFKLLKASSDTIKEVVVMCKSESPGFDFMLRSFCPWIGIDEDPVTGSIHSVLGGYWKQKLNKDNLIAYQASERGGYLFVRSHAEKVEIGGHVKVIIEGRMVY